MPVETDKQRALDAIRVMPDGATMDDVIERPCFIAKIEDGLRQSRAGSRRLPRRGQAALLTRRTTHLSWFAAFSTRSIACTTTHSLGDYYQSTPILQFARSLFDRIAS